MKAALVHSGGGDETSLDDQDTLVQLEEIAAVLNGSGMETQNFAFESSLGNLEKSLHRMRPDFIFNLVETVGGTDSLLYVAAAFFEYLKIPYTGCSAISLALLSSKIRQKEFMRNAGLPVPGDENAPNGKWIVKSDSEHASVGISSGSVVDTLVAANKKIQEKQKEFGGVWFAERFIDGREFNISILDNGDGKPQVLHPAEILFVDYPEDTPKIIDYAAKWDTQSYAYNATPRSFDFMEKDEALLAKLNELCCKCWDLFELRGSARVDFRVDEFGKPWILEINANPCLSSDAGFMAAAMQTGLAATEVIKRLLPQRLLESV